MFIKTFLSKCFCLKKRFFYLINMGKYKFSAIWKHKYKVDLGLRTKWSLGEKIKYNLLGYTNEDYFTFNLKNNDYHNYISYWERLRLEDINGRFGYILGEKLMFERLFGRYISVPHIYCLIKDGSFVNLDTAQTLDLLEILHNKKALIAKPTRSVGGGVGIHKLKFEDENIFIDNQIVSQKQFIQTVSTWQEYIISDYIQQADYSKNIFSETVNSIRVVTVKRKSGRFEVVMAFHRFGTEASKPVDNYSSDGCFSCVDINTGCLSAAARITEPEKRFSCHPDSSVPIEGVVVPNWEKVKEKLLNVHRCFSYFIFFAWDVVISESGEPYVLEINRGSDLSFQMIKPLRNEELGRFMHEYNLLDNR